MRKATDVQVDFSPSAATTLGVEWELGLVDPGSGDLVSGAGEVLAALGPGGTGGTGGTIQSIGTYQQLILQVYGLCCSMVAKIITRAGFIRNI